MTKTIKAKAVLAALPSNNKIKNMNKHSNSWELRRQLIRACNKALFDAYNLRPCIDIQHELLNSIQMLLKLAIRGDAE